MRLLITGINGLLGSNLAHYLAKRGFTVIGSGRQAQCQSACMDYVPGDLAALGFAGRLINDARPDAIINCVGLADVNLCEADPLLARKINTETAAHLARAARHCRLLHISTDHLFKGEDPMRTESDATDPVNEYGKSKLAGEQEVLSAHANALVIRTNFYGWSPAGHAATFADWLYDSLAQKKPIQLFTNYYFNSIEVSFLAQALEEALNSDFKGILNIAGTQRCSKYEFGKAMADVFGFSMDHVSASEFNPESLKVKRPKDLSLSTNRFAQRFKSHLPNLQEGLARLHAEKRVLHES